MSSISGNQAILLLLVICVLIPNEKCIFVVGSLDDIKSLVFIPKAFLWGGRYKKEHSSASDKINPSSSTTNVKHDTTISTSTSSSCNNKNDNLRHDSSNNDKTMITVSSLHQKSGLTFNAEMIKFVHQILTIKHQKQQKDASIRSMEPHTFQRGGEVMIATTSSTVLNNDRYDNDDDDVLISKEIQNAATQNVIDTFQIEIQSLFSKYQCETRDVFKLLQQEILVGLQESTKKKQHDEYQGTTNLSSSKQVVLTNHNNNSDSSESDMVVERIQPIETNLLIMDATTTSPNSTIFEHEAVVDGGILKLDVDTIQNEIDIASFEKQPTIPSFFSRLVSMIGSNSQDEDNLELQQESQNQQHQQQSETVLNFSTLPTSIKSISTMTELIEDENKATEYINLDSCIAGEEKLLNLNEYAKDNNEKIEEIIPSTNNTASSTADTFNPFVSFVNQLRSIAQQIQQPSIEVSTSSMFDDGPKVTNKDDIEDDIVAAQELRLMMDDEEAAVLAVEPNDDVTSVIIPKYVSKVLVGKQAKKKRKKIKKKTAVDLKGSYLSDFMVYDDNNEEYNNELQPTSVLEELHFDNDDSQQSVYDEAVVPIVLTSKQMVEQSNIVDAKVVINGLLASPRIKQVVKLVLSSILFLILNALVRTLFDLYFMKFSATPSIP